MSDLDVNTQIRAMAVQAAAYVLKEAAWTFVPDVNEHDPVRPSKELESLTSQIAMYIKHGSWVVDPV